MKDLFVLTADADAEVVFRSVLTRHRDLGIRSVSFDVRRFPGRDSGMVKEGPELARVMVSKSEYSRLLLSWDRDGSGWERRSAGDAEARIQERLEGVTWLGRSSPLVLVPELEEWLWHCTESIALHLGVSDREFEKLFEQAVAKLDRTPERARRDFPKELFEELVYGRLRRKPLPEDFRRIADRADLKLWRRSPSFARLTGILQSWFPD